MKVFNYLTGFLFVVSVYFSIRWSTLPVVDRIFDNPFWVANGKIDAAMLNLITGYFMGYLVYLFTVLVPQQYRRDVIMKEIVEQLCSIYVRSMYMLLLMAKSASDDITWRGIESCSDDWDCFNENFYDAMKEFDITSDAETVLLKFDGNKNVRLKWYEYLEKYCSNIYAEIDNIVIRYSSDMPENLLQCLYAIKASRFFEMILGKGINCKMFLTDYDGNEYMENIPISLYCIQAENAKNKVAPIFDTNREVAGVEMLKAYISELKKLYNILTKYDSEKRVTKKSCLEIFKKHKIGMIGASKFNYKEKEIMPEQ